MPKSKVDLLREMANDPTSHGGDLVRGKNGRILIRHPHHEGPCLFDMMADALIQYRVAKKDESVARDEVIAARHRVREAHRTARQALFRLVQAGLDAKLSYRRISEATGIAVGTLHLAHTDDPNAADGGKQPRSE